MACVVQLVDVWQWHQFCAEDGKADSTVPTVVPVAPVPPGRHMQRGGFQSVLVLGAGLWNAG